MGCTVLRGFVEFIPGELFAGKRQGAACHKYAGNRWRSSNSNLEKTGMSGGWNSGKRRKFCVPRMSTIQYIYTMKFCARLIATAVSQNGDPSSPIESQLSLCD